MRSAHSVSLQIYVFPFTCFAFSSFFCHFVFSPSSLPPSRAPHCAASSRRVSPDWRGRDRRSVSVADKSPPLSRRGPLAGSACILLTRMSTSERRVGEGRFFFVLPPCLLFPLFYFAWRCAQSLGATAQEGCWRCVNPFRAMHYRNKGCYPPRKSRFHPSVRCLSTTERRVGEGRFFFVSPPCLLFPLFYFAWRCAQPLRAIAQEGYWHFVCSISWTHRPFDEASNDAGAGNEWVSARRQKTRGQLHGNGELFAPPSSFVFERRARRVSSNRAVAVRGRRWKDTAAKETNAGQKRNL